MKGIGKICLLISLFLISPVVSGADDTGKILLDGTTVYITSGDSYTLYQKYIISVKSVRDDGSIWLQLTINDEAVKSDIVAIGDYFIYNKTNITIFSARVNNVYAGSSEEGLVTLSPVYQYKDPDLPAPVMTEKVPDNNMRIDNENPPAGIYTPMEPLVWLMGIILIVILFYILRKLW
ncbi:MAG: S-layer protein domain-containing protein [Candidatus Methanoperedens sp.]|nr:S-layer protein domain-containing protein [Candidatus Methanoperedens sp.]